VLLADEIGDEDLDPGARGHGILDPGQLDQVGDDVVAVTQQVGGQADAGLGGLHVVLEELMGQLHPGARVAVDVVAHAQGHGMAHAVAGDDLVEGPDQGQADAGFGVGGGVGQFDRDIAARVGDVFHIGFDFDQGGHLAGPAEQDVVAGEHVAGDGVLALGADEGDGGHGNLDGPDRPTVGGVAQGLVEQVLLVGGQGGGGAAGVGAVEERLVEDLVMVQALDPGQIDRDRGGGVAEGRA
jgi:hypothetical protein